jgi:hypothetical protein
MTFKAIACIFFYKIGLALVQSNTTLWLHAIVTETGNGKRLLPNLFYKVSFNVLQIGDGCLR